MTPPADFLESERLEARLQHPCFPQLRDPNTPVWRYMDFAKFVALLKSRSIYLTRVDRFTDPYEGTTTPRTAAGIGQFLKNMGSAHDEAYVLNMLDAARRELFVSCWHANEHESEAMWRLYCGDGGGVAIQTTYSALLEAVRWHQGVYIGAVSYVDYRNTSFPDANIFYPVMHKRASFIHEREVRLVKLSPPQLDGTQELALSLSVELEGLCKAIYVSPSSPSYYFEAVKAVVDAIAPNLSSRLQYSQMTSPPLRPPQKISNGK